MLCSFSKGNTFVVGQLALFYHIDARVQLVRRKSCGSGHLRFPWQHVEGAVRQMVRSGRILSVLDKPQQREQHRSRSGRARRTRDIGCPTSTRHPLRTVALLLHSVLQVASVWQHCGESALSRVRNQFTSLHFTSFL